MLGLDMSSSSSTNIDEDSKDFDPVTLTLMTEDLQLW